MNAVFLAMSLNQQHAPQNMRQQQPANNPNKPNIKPNNKLHEEDVYDQASRNPSKQDSNINLDSNLNQDGNLNQDSDFNLESKHKPMHANNYSNGQSDDLEPELVQLDQQNAMPSSQDDNIEEIEGYTSDVDGGDGGDKGATERGHVDEIDEANEKDKEARTDGRRNKSNEHTLNTKHIRWAGYVWRRGMVPLWWQILPQPTATNASPANAQASPSEFPPSVQVNSNSSASAATNVQSGTTGASITISSGEVGTSSDGGSVSASNFFSANGGHTAALTGVVHHNPFQQCVTYYQRVLQRYDSLVHLLLLRPASLDYQEAALSDLLAESLKHVLKTFGKPIEIIEFDWISSLRTAGLNVSVESLFSKLKDTVKDFNYSCGSDASGKVIIKRQTGVVRLSCADSLDRSHMVNFFFALPVLAELAKSVTLLPASPAFTYFEQSLESVTRSLKNIGLLDIVTTVFAHMGDVGSILFANQLAGAPTIISAMLRGYTSISRPLLLDLDQRLHSQRAYVHSNNEATRNSHYQLFLGLDSPPPPPVLVSHNSLVLTTFSSPPLNPRHSVSPLSRTCTMVIVLPHPAYVYELVVRGAGGCQMSVSLGSYEDSHTHTLSLHGVLVPHANTSLVFTLPSSPFKTHSNEYLLPYLHRPTRVVKLTFTYHWQPQVDIDNKPNSNSSEKTKATPKSTFNFSFANFGSSSNDATTSRGSRYEENNGSNMLQNFTKPYVGVLGHWVGVLDILSTPDIPSADSTSSREFQDANKSMGTSMSRLANDSMNNMCVSRTVDDIKL